MTTPVQDLQIQFNDVISLRWEMHDKANDSLQRGDLVAALKYSDKRTMLGKLALELQARQKTFMTGELIR